MISDCGKRKPDILRQAKELQFNKKLWLIKFPKLPIDKLKQLRLTDVGAYSIARINTAIELVRFIKEECSVNSPIITETHGGIGGFSNYLCHNFNKVNIVEIDPLHVEILQNNLKVFNVNMKNVSFFQANYLDVYSKIKQDVIVSDPPWGGTNYKEKDSIKLKIDNLDLICIINHLFKINCVSLFIFLAMKNFDFISFFNTLDIHLIPFIRIKRFENHFLISIKNEIKK